MMPRMRTVDQAVAQIRQDDPQSCLTRHALRKLVLTGVVPCVKTGKKRLINYDRLLAFLACETPTANPSPARAGIRYIVE